MITATYPNSYWSNISKKGEAPIINGCLAFFYSSIKMEIASNTQRPVITAVS